MEIRGFAKGDMSALRRLMHNALGYDVPLEQLEKRIRAMEQEKGYFLFIAAEKGQVAGFIGLHAGLAFELPGRVLRVIALAVDPAGQGQGIGSALLRQGERLAAQHQFSAILVNSGLSREAAHRFYEKHSFFVKGYSFCKYLK